MAAELGLDKFPRRGATLICRVSKSVARLGSGGELLSRGLRVGAATGPPLCSNFDIPPLPSDQPRKCQAGSLISGHSWVVSFRRGRMQQEERRQGLLRGCVSRPGVVPPTALWRLLPSGVWCLGTQPPARAPDTSQGVSTGFPARAKTGEEIEGEGALGSSWERHSSVLPTWCWPEPLTSPGPAQGAGEGASSHVMGNVKTRNFLTTPGGVPELLVPCSGMETAAKARFRN